MLPPSLHVIFRIGDGSPRRYLSFDTLPSFLTSYSSWEAHGRDMAPRSVKSHSFIPIRLVSHLHVPGIILTPSTPRLDGEIIADLNCSVLLCFPDIELLLERFPPQKRGNAPPTSSPRKCYFHLQTFISIFHLPLPHPLHPLPISPRTSHSPFQTSNHPTNHTAQSLHPTQNPTANQTHPAPPAPPAIPPNFHTGTAHVQHKYPNSTKKILSLRSKLP